MIQVSKSSSISTMSVQSFDQDFNNLTITSISSNNSPIFNHESEKENISNAEFSTNKGSATKSKEFKTGNIKNSQSIKNLENLLDFSINNKNNDVKKILTTETILNNDQFEHSKFDPNFTSSIKEDEKFQAPPPLHIENEKNSIKSSISYTDSVKQTPQPTQEIRELKEIKEKKKFNFKGIFSKKKKLSVRNYSSNPNLSNYSAPSTVTTNKSTSFTSSEYKPPMSSFNSKLNGSNASIPNSQSSINFSSSSTSNFKKSIFNLKKKKSMTNLSSSEFDKELSRNFSPDFSKHNVSSNSIHSDNKSLSDIPQPREIYQKRYNGGNNSGKSSIHEDFLQVGKFKLDDTDDILSFGEEFNMSNMMDDSKGFPYGFGSDDDDDESFDNSNTEKLQITVNQESNLEHNLMDKFPKNLDTKEIESIVSIERSRSIKSIKNKQNIAKSNSHKKNLNLNDMKYSDAEPQPMQQASGFLSEFRDIINFDTDDNMEDSFITAKSETSSQDLNNDQEINLNQDEILYQSFTGQQEVDKNSNSDLKNQHPYKKTLSPIVTSNLGAKSPIITIDSPILNSILINESNNDEATNTGGMKRPISMSFKKSLFQNKEVSSSIESFEKIAVDDLEKSSDLSFSDKDIYNSKDNSHDKITLAEPSSLPPPIPTQATSTIPSMPKVQQQQQQQKHRQQAAQHQQQQQHQQHQQHQKPKAESKKVRFSSRIILYDTYNEDLYDRHPEVSTCNQLTPWLAQQIKDELNLFKSEMIIHDNSRCYTHFF